MPSIQAKITFKILQLLDFGWSKGSLAKQRSRLENLTRFLPIPRGMTLNNLSADGVRAALFETTNAKPGIILYLHGGAYAVGSVKVHRNFLGRLAKVCRMNILAIDYHLAPEHPFPAALEDALTAFRWLLSQGYGPGEMVIAGDSAGGGLAIATLISLRDSQLPLPACAVCISPWVNLACTQEKSNNNNDPLLNPAILEAYSRYYAGETDSANPLMSPVFANLQGLPPILIQVGTNEILLDQVEEFCEKARQAKVEIEMDRWQGMFHVFQMIPILPETKHSLKKIANFIAKKTNPDCENCK